MTNNLNALKKYFESGTAEGDNRFLGDVFVTSDEYVDLISVPESGPRILLGKKGTGKTAILRNFQEQLEDIDIPSLLLRPKDLDIENISDPSLGPLTRAAETAILRSVAIKVGETLKGFVPEEEGRLRELAKQKGKAQEDFVERAISFLEPLGKAVTNVDFSALRKAKDGNDECLRQALESSLIKGEKVFYVLVDDTDQIASPDDRNHLNRIWSFLLAARSINEACVNIKFIISIREEVWRRLTRDEAGQRDQVDHFRNLSKKINVTDQVVEKIIEKRLIAASSEIGEEGGGDPYKPFFDTERVKIPTADEEYRYWSDFIVGRSRQRPRDSIQLVYKLANYAEKQGKELIASDDVEKVMPVFSEERVDDLARECESECPQIKDIIRSFHDVEFDSGSFTLSPQDTADFLNSIPSRFRVTLFGRNLTHGNREDVFGLWRYLFEIGFLNARVTDSRQKKDYRHISAEEDPDLVSLSRWNEMQAILWEVNPAYRDYLMKLQSESEFTFGQPKKRKKKR